MMSRVFLSNFDFEHTLAGVHRRNAATIATDLAAVWLAIAEADDAIHGLASVDDDFESELNAIGRAFPRGELSPLMTLVPWGWDATAAEFAKQHGNRANAPAATAVKGVNSRRFSFELEQRLHSGLAGSAVVATLEDFDRAVSGLARWVAKAEFSMSGRERIVGCRAASEVQRNWLAKRLAENSVVFIEPWVEVQDECGVQFEIHRNGEVELIGVTGLLTTEQGSFAGCRVSSEPEVGWVDIETVTLAAKAVAAQGYFGPLGIDAARYLQDGGTRIRFLQDVNGRYTMGRIALGYRDALGDGEQAAWLFLPNRAGSFHAVHDKLRTRLPAGVRFARTSPNTIAGRPVDLGTLLVISNDPDALKATCKIAFEICGRSLRW